MDFIDLEDEQACIDFFNDYRPSLMSRILQKLSDVKWWFFHRFHPRHRYHVVRTGLKPGYYDKDYLLERCIVQLLIDFFEKENPEEKTSEPDRYTELKGLYEYFKVNPCDDIWPTKFSSYEEYEQACEEFTKKLIRVVELRGLMWT